MRTRLLGLVAAATIVFSQSGCLKAILTNGQISATRTASGAMDTVGDFEMARSSIAAGLSQFEGMHRLAPDNTDALFLLTKGWAGYGFAIAEDDMETAQDKNDPPRDRESPVGLRQHAEELPFFTLQQAPKHRPSPTSSSPAWLAPVSSEAGRSTRRALPDR